MKSLVVFMLPLILPLLVNAADIGLSVKAVGMGGAYTTVVRDADSLFYNPAGYAKMSGFNWTIFDLALGMNKLDSYQDYLDIAEDTSDVSQIISDLYGENVTLYGGSKSAFSIGGLSFGAYGLLDSNFQVNNPAYPNLFANYNLDYGFFVGWGLELIPNFVQIGMQTRRITRTGGEVPIGPSIIATLDPDQIQDELGRSGTGWAFDWGINLVFPGALQPTIAFTWRDMGNTEFINSSGGLAPNPVKQEHTLGVGLNYESMLMSIRPAIDFRYLNHHQMQLGKRLHVGLEIEWPLLTVRGGLNQGYYTAGASIDLSVLRIDAATYGVELGEYPGQLEDRRYMINLSFDFGIDPDFSFSSNNSSETVKKHGRKLRR